MDFTKIVKEYTWNIKAGTIFTEDLPIKWHCTCLQKEGEKYELKLILLEVDSGIEKNDMVLWIDVYAYNDDAKYPILKRRRISTSDLKWDITINIQINPDITCKILTITFTLFFPQQRKLTLAGYDFSENNPTNDQIMVVGRRKFHINKAVLSAYSPVLNNLFHNENFEEAKKEEIELKEIDANEFEVFLQVIHPTNVTVNANNVEFLWKLADRFGVNSVAQMCEKFFCDLEGRQAGNFSISNRMKLAQLYHSDKLMSAISETMKKLKM